jgi:hypothetical protein
MRAALRRPRDRLERRVGADALAGECELAANAFRTRAIRSVRLRASRLMLNGPTLTMSRLSGLRRAWWKRSRSLRLVPIRTGPSIVGLTGIVGDAQLTELAHSDSVIGSQRL